MTTQNYVCRLIDYDTDKAQHLVIEMLTDNGKLLGVAATAAQHR